MKHSGPIAQVAERRVEAPQIRAQNPVGPPNSSRRGFLKAALGAICAPAFVKASSLWLPPEKPLITVLDKETWDANMEDVKTRTLGGLDSPGSLLYTVQECGGKIRLLTEMMGHGNQVITLSDTGFTIDNRVAFL